MKIAPDTDNLFSCPLTPLTMSEWCEIESLASERDCGTREGQATRFLRPDLDIQWPQGQLLS